MPFYDMACDKCSHNFEIQKTIHDPLPSKCPKCKSKKVYQVYSVPLAKVENQPKTLGALADLNAAKFSEHRKNEIIESISGPLPKNPDGSYIPQKKVDRTKLKKLAKIAGMSPKKQADYVRTGKM
jgi:putative FmdB family regulatory protein